MPAKKTTTAKSAKQPTDIPSRDDDYEQSAINLKRRDWKLLRRVADTRADKVGGRRSVSGVIADLVEASRKRLEGEARSSE